MTRGLNAALLAAVLISQPRYMRADGENIVKAAAVVGGVALIWWAFQPDSDETVIKKARNLIDTIGQHPRVVGHTEFDQQCFAQGLQGSVDDVQKEFLKERAALNDLYDDVLARLKKSESDTRLIALHDCARGLKASLDALNIKHAYLNEHVGYFKLYKANERARALIERGCPAGYNNSCAQDFRIAMNDVERHKNGVPYTALHNQVETYTYPQLVKKYGDINKQIEDDRRQKENLEAVATAGRVLARVFVGSQQQPAAAQQEQAAVDQAKKNSVVTNHQEEALRQAKRRQQPQQTSNAQAEEQAGEQAKKNSIDTYNKEQENRAKKNSVETYKQEEEQRKQAELHKNCPADRCLRGLSQQECPAQQKNHAACTHDVCYKGSAAQCPAYQVHKNCTDIWCSHHQDAWCPRFHDRSQLRS